MVLYIPSIPLINFAEEGRKFIAINHGFDSQFFDDSEGDCLHQALSANLLGNFKNVEVNLTNLIQSFAVIVNNLYYSVERGTL
jgi:hypothetical protein